jgi:hypothetical protein
MSYLMYAKPAPVPDEEVESFSDIKHVIARRYTDTDGSIKTERLHLTRSSIGFLEGVAAAGNPNVKLEAATLIQMIKANEQGIWVWVGDPDDN